MHERRARDQRVESLKTQQNDLLIFDNVANN